MAIKTHLQLQNRSRSFVALINPAPPVKKAKSTAYILQMEKKSNRFHLALGITAKPVVEPEIDAGWICIPFLM